jgi:Acyl-CoA hydrolase
MEGKTVEYSRLVKRHRPSPSEANNNGVMHGGLILFHLDMACGMTAMRHCGTRVVTVSVDRMDFKSAVQMGENMLFKTSVNMVHRSSLEVGARIEAEDAFTGDLRHVGTAYLTFVALNEDGRPTRVRPLVAETSEDTRRMADAVRRRNLRRMERWQADGRAFSFAIDLLPETFSLCRLAPGVAMPTLPPGSFSAIAADAMGLSLVVPEHASTGDAPWQSERDAGGYGETGWRAFTLRSDLDLSLSGVVSTVSSILAAEKISIQYISTFTSAYFLVRGDQVEATISALITAGHRVYR